MKKHFILNKVLILLPIFLLACGASADNHNLTSSALGHAIGFPNLEYSYKLADHLTLGIMGSSGKAELDNMEVKGSAVGAIARYYFEPAFTNNSWYLVTNANKNNFEVTITDEGIDYIGESKETVVGAGAGYHWFWDSFNISLGALLTNQPKMKLFDTAGSKYKDSLDTNIGIDFTMGGKF